MALFVVAMMKRGLERSERIEDDEGPYDAATLRAGRKRVHYHGELVGAEMASEIEAAEAARDKGKP